jgi:hypothetical protein
MQSKGTSFYRVALEPTTGWPVTLQRHLVAVAMIADQVRVALVSRLRSACPIRFGSAALATSVSTTSPS